MVPSERKPEAGTAPAATSRLSRLGFIDARRTTDPAVGRPADLPADVRALPTAGRGPVLYPEVLTAGLGAPELLDVDPAALGLLALRRLDEGVEMPVEPLYLRRPDALTTAERATR